MRHGATGQSIRQSATGKEQGAEAVLQRTSVERESVSA